jgi:hypothetical protein
MNMGRSNSMVKSKKLLYIAALCIVLGIAVKLSYFYLIGHEGIKYFSIIKAIVQLKTTDDKIIKVSDNPSEFIFKASDVKDIEKLVKEQGFEGREYYKSVKHISANKYIRTGIRMFSSKYIILTYTTIEKDN